MTSDNPGLRVCPSLGGTEDRHSLIQAMHDGTITATAVHAVPLDDEDMLLPMDQRPAGLSGHHLVLPALWNALVRERRWSIEKLWQALSFGPSTLLDQPPERLEQGSRRWLLFDPNHSWCVSRDDADAPRASNLPWIGRTLAGRVIACGLSR